MLLGQLKRLLKVVLRLEEAKEWKLLKVNGNLTGENLLYLWKKIGLPGFDVGGMDVNFEAGAEVGEIVDAMQGTVGPHGWHCE